MKSGRARRLACALCLVLAVPGRSPALDISTREIAALSLSPGCLDYGIAGTCFFLVCELFECHIETTSRISHYLPDAVVSSYQRTGENPWAEMAGLGAAGAGVVSGLLGAAAEVLVDGGHQREGTRIEAHENVRFKEVDVIGNPIASAEAAAAFGVEFLCKSEAESFSPYFVSTLDAIGWRLGVTELIYPATFIPGLRENRGLALEHLGIGPSAAGVPQHLRGPQGRSRLCPARGRHRDARVPAPRLRFARWRLRGRRGLRAGLHAAGPCLRE